MLYMKLLIKITIEKFNQKIKFTDKIIFKDIKFKYPNSKKDILYKLNFEIKKIL